MSAATITLLFLLFAVVMFVFEKIPLGVTSMIVCIGLVVTGVLDVKTAFAGFIDSNVILFVAMFIVGGALFETGMANKIGGIVTHFARSERSLIVAIMVIVGLMSGFLSNTGTAAVLIPVVIGIAAKSGYARSKLLMPLVFAAAMGGNLSLIGAPGNLIAQSALGEIGMSFGFFEYAIVGLPILAVGILFYATFGMKLLPNHPVSDDDSFGGEQDFSNVPKWKQVLSLVILVLTLLGMIFEKQIGIKLCITGCIGALALRLDIGTVQERERPVVRGPVHDIERSTARRHGADTTDTDLGTLTRLSVRRNSLHTGHGTRQGVRNVGYLALADILGLHHGSRTRKGLFFGRTVCYHDHVVNRLRILLHHDVHTGFSGDSNTLGLIADEGHQQNTLPGNRNRVSAVSTRRRSDRRSVHHDCGTCYRSTGSVGNCTGNLLVLGHCNGANPQNSN